MDVQPKKNESWIWKSILIRRNVCSIGIDVQVWRGHQTSIVNGSIKKIDKGCDGTTFLIKDLICPITHTWNYKEVNHIQDQVFKQEILEIHFQSLEVKIKLYGSSIRVGNFQPNRHTRFFQRIVNPYLLRGSTIRHGRDYGLLNSHLS